MKARGVGFDFGTTNSAIAVVGRDGRPRCASFPSLGGDLEYQRTVIYAWLKEKPLRGVGLEIGSQAIEYYLEGDHIGRLLQSLKSFLGSKSFNGTQLFSKYFTLEDLIAFFAHEIKRKAEVSLDTLGPRVVVGRPVRFANSEGQDDDDFAIGRLKEAIEARGFDQVEFAYEPIAAAYTYERMLARDELVLIGDFGGGTSDFALIRLGPSHVNSRDRSGDILGSHGVGIAGDRFDYKMIHALVVPELGYGGSFRSLGKLLPMPTWIYRSFEQWHMLSLLKTQKTLALIRDLQTQALEPEKLRALLFVVENDLGFHLYRAIQDTKTSLSHDSETVFSFAAGPLKLEQKVLRSDFEGWIAEELNVIAGCVDHLLNSCGVSPGDVDSVFLTGGSSYVPAIRKIFVDRVGREKVKSGDNLTSVALGLALMAQSGIQRHE